MTDARYKVISASLNIAQSMMLASGIDQNEIFEVLLNISPFDCTDEEYFNDVTDDLNKICEREEIYEICSFLKEIKEKIKL